MLLLLSALLVALLILEFTKWKFVRIVILVAVIVVTIRVIADYQTQVRKCYIEEVSTVETIADLGTNGCPMVVQAADAYLKDKQNATYEKPFSFGFNRYLNAQKNQKDFQQIDSGNAGISPRP